MSYRRVIPRDLFNESKLLKCLGQLALLVHEGKADGLGVRHRSPSSGFMVNQDPSDGGLFCDNLEFRLGDGTVVHLKSNYNSKEPYPFLFYVGDETAGSVFEDDGTLSEEFSALINDPKHRVKP